jgi:hypothetical protein
MKAISIRQPWAHFIVNGFKTVENRTWYMKHRGPLLIHASKGMTFKEQADAYRFACGETTMRAAMMPSTSDLQLGGIVGIVDVVDCIANGSGAHPKMLPMDLQWFVGDYGIVMRNARVLPFAPYKGRLGLFEVDATEYFDNV